MLAKLTLLGSCLIASTAVAETCPPTVRLEGEAALVASVGKALTARGIGLEATPCPVIEARLERREQSILVQVIPADGPVERMVRESETAATVIESFARRDVGSPLLAIQAVPRTPAPPAPSSPEPLALVAQPSSAPTVPRGLHVFAGLESSYASDNSAWFGFQLGACVMVGPICIAARLRSGESPDGSGMVERRHTWEMLGGIDVPFALGGWRFSPGFGFGPSSMRTSMVDDMKYSTDGLRADAHATLTIPLTARFAFDINVAANLLQQVNVDGDHSTGPVPPDEPWGFLRLGVALRYGRQ